MPRRLLPLLVCVAVAAAVGSAAGEAPPAPASPPLAAAGPAALGHPAEPEPPGRGPFPARRLPPTEAQVPEVLKPLDAGPLARLPRGEFEARVRAAGRVAADARVVPRVTDARFKAALVG